MADRGVGVAVAVLLLCATRAFAQETPPTAQSADATSQPTVNVILDTSSFWRFRTVRETEEIVLPNGDIRHARVVAKDMYPFFQKNPAEVEAPASMWKAEDVPVVRLPSQTAAGWMKPEFNDGGWARLRGPMLAESYDDDWKLILMRGHFEVTDPARAGGLRLSMTFRGGAIVYLNGEELTRASMPAGPIDLYTSANAYPDDVYFSAEGFVLSRRDKSPENRPRIEKRFRRLTEFKIPSARLRKGVNVLAVGIHRAPTLARYYVRHVRGSYTGHDDCLWAKISLNDIQLIADPGAAVLPNVGLLKDRGFKLWNQSTIQTVYLPDYPDPFSTPQAIRLTGARNGTFAGQVVIGDDKPIAGLKVAASELKGPGAIPAAAVRIRYGVADGSWTPRAFDSLEDEVPAEVPVYAEHGGALQPIWVTVAVPADARPGDYAGSLTIGANGVKPVELPLTLRVADWALPPVADYATTLDVIQSPESVAMAYDVPLWSEAHFKLLDRTFTLLGPLSVKTLYITCIRRTHFGNEHAMVRWIRGADGELTPDFSIVEKYLDTAARRLGKPRGIILYCWEPPESQGHAGVSAARTSDKPILITVVDPQTGKMLARQGPAWGTPEAKVFWKKMTDGMRAVLAKRGLESAMMFGLLGDHRPTKQAMDDISNGVPDDRWAIHSHLYADEWQGHKLGFVIALWGIGCQPADPAEGYSFGWSNPLWLSYYPREMKLSSTLVEHRVKLENWLGARRSYTPFVAKGMGPRGLGRLGGDFWDVVKDERGRVRDSLAGRYPEAAWGQLNLTFCVPYLLGKGKTGALATVRTEAFREGLQEVEARVFVEKALLDDAARTLLGEELMARCRTALDERIRMCLHAGGEGQPWFISSGWTERTELLFGLAAEIARKLGREPKPNLTPEPVKKR